MPRQMVANDPARFVRAITDGQLIANRPNRQTLCSMASSITCRDARVRSRVPGPKKAINGFPNMLTVFVNQSSCEISNLIQNKTVF